MKRSTITEIQKKGRGRPATGRDPAITSRIPEETVAAVDRWAKKNDVPTRGEAIRRLVELGLTIAPKTRPIERALAHATELAAKAKA